jgi:C-terminal processing protease CtpA/Prc
LGSDSTNLANCRPCARFILDSYFLGVEALYNPDPSEAMVSGVYWPSPAFDAGLHVGDSILTINGKAIASMSGEEVAKLLGAEGTLPTTFQVSRLGRKKTFTVKPATYRSAEAAIGRKWNKFSGGQQYRPVPKGCPSS